MELIIDFPGGTRVDAHFNEFTVHTDQPVKVGGAGSAPSPFELFLASLATCAGFYVLSFCRQRGVPTDGIRLIQHTEKDSVTGMVSTVRLDIQLPSDFPQKYAAAVVRATEQCAVKKHLEHPPVLEITTSIGADVNKTG